MAAKKILIVDDENLLVETIKDRLEFTGYEVRTAGNGAEALKFLESETVDLIIMDVAMPVMDGIQTTKVIKTTERLKKIPVIFLTASVRRKDEQETREAGGNDYMTKPFEVASLLKMIEKWTSAE